MEIELTTYNEFIKNNPNCRKFSQNKAMQMLFNYLCKEEIIIKMIDSIEAKKPALAGCVVQLKKKIAELNKEADSKDFWQIDLNDTFVRKAIGIMVKHILMDYGYKVIGQKEFTKELKEEAKPFTSGSCYEFCGDGKLEVIKILGKKKSYDRFNMLSFATKNRGDQFKPNFNSSMKNMDNEFAKKVILNSMPKDDNFGENAPMNAQVRKWYSLEHLTMKNIVERYWTYEITQDAEGRYFCECPFCNSTSNKMMFYDIACCFSLTGLQENTVSYDCIEFVSKFFDISKEQAWGKIKKDFRFAEIISYPSIYTVEYLDKNFKLGVMDYYADNELEAEKLVLKFLNKYEWDRIIQNFQFEY